MINKENIEAIGEVVTELTKTVDNLTQEVDGLKIIIVGTVAVAALAAAGYGIYRFVNRNKEAPKEITDNC
jgi:hypothetical protein